MTFNTTIYVISLIVLLIGCTASDNTSPAAGDAAATTPSQSDVRITGLANLKQTALVLTDSCRSMKFETDRRPQARAAIDRALESYAKKTPGGLTVDVQSLSVKLRCHFSGAGNFGSYCAADATLRLTVSGPGLASPIALDTTREASESSTQVLICLNAMPAVTAVVDKVVNESLSDLQRQMAARSGDAPR
ncbi:MAG: hypothetical protein LCH95_02875 [Proteobacteria bacterium]|nr:hypothetical protein [Pseudomonadota bacterium]